MLAILKTAMRCVICIVAFLHVAALFGVQGRAQSPPSPPPLPDEDVGACPFEGCVDRDWQANDSVVALTTRNAGAAAFTVRKGESVTALDGSWCTSPDVCDFMRLLTCIGLRFEVVNLGGRSIRRPTQSGVLHVEPGDVLFTLTYRGEGNFAAWFNGPVGNHSLDGSRSTTESASSTRGGARVTSSSTRRARGGCTYEMRAAKRAGRARRRSSTARMRSTVSWSTSSLQPQ